MAGIVRKLFKNKKTKKVENDSDDDYSELYFVPTTSSSTPKPKKPYQFTADVPLNINTPKLRHDETIDSDLSFEQPTHKRRRVNQTTSQRDIFASEDSIYEYTQYQLTKWNQQEERHQERRKRKRVERHQEQENYVHSGIADFKLGVPTVEDVEKLRKERDQYKKEMEKYKGKCEDLEKIIVQLQRRQPAAPVFQPFSNYNFFGVGSNFPSVFQPFQPTSLLQQQQLPQQNAGPVFNFGASSTSQSVPDPFSNTASSSDESVLNGMGPVGPMAPRYPDPIDNSLLFQDDDTSLSDLSNSSKSDISEDLK
ncbi:hypothetical protein GCK72_019872 [Caenorhabditis remanei]|uniref:Uncharacterized protein n=1 Tax=Caenorhabditis remanei TaxID=31234 RepID=A0A6A5GF38_CAERE|nr:hypothetical protein GCK72_019872 [Caenorhabditis remanei]KAF1753316.1 hypothetical protein GCK72_019872 [Caenorhabditis remanei]